MLFWRVGNINVNRQTLESAPEKRGLWAFPWPFHDYFFVNQQYDKFLPKKYRQIDLLWGKVSQEEYDALWREKERLLLGIMKREKPKTFWYGGGFYSHISPDNSKEDWYYWESPREWSKVCNKYIITYYKTDYGIQKMKYSVDHMEVFIPG
jgi:hypothetical protein